MEGQGQGSAKAVEGGTRQWKANESFVPAAQSAGKLGRWKQRLTGQARRERVVRAW